MIHCRFLFVFRALRILSCLRNHCRVEKVPSPIFNLSLLIEMPLPLQGNSCNVLLQNLVVLQPSQHQWLQHNGVKPCPSPGHSQHSQLFVNTIYAVVPGCTCWTKSSTVPLLCPTLLSVQFDRVVPQISQFIHLLKLCLSAIVWLFRQDASKSRKDDLGLLFPVNSAGLHVCSTRWFSIDGGWPCPSLSLFTTATFGSKPSSLASVVHALIPLIPGMNFSSGEKKLP